MMKNILINWQIKKTEFYGITQNNILVAGGIFVSNHCIIPLGVCSSDYLKFGLSNLYLYDASIEFIKKSSIYEFGGWQINRSK